ncbi:MAG: hypothetical protein ACTSQG_08180, partial [Promethearchaeota archaeon]
MENIRVFQFWGWGGWNPNFQGWKLGFFLIILKKKNQINIYIFISMSFLDDKLVKELARIKDRLKQSTHQILQSSQWNKDAEVLANSGVKILKGIEELRDSVRDLKIPFLFFRVRKRLI